MPCPQLSMNKNLEEDICIHLFTVSAAMVGVCLTVIGLIRVVISLRNMGTLADDLLSVDALFFLCSCLCAYWALRMRTYSSSPLAGADCRWGLHPGFDFDGGCLLYYYL